MLGTLASDSEKKILPLQLDSKVNSAPHEYFLKKLMAHISATASPTKPCFDFSSGGTVDIKMK